MFRKWFSKREPDAEGSIEEDDIPDGAVDEVVENKRPRKVSKTKRKPKKPARRDSEPLPKIGAFENGKDSYGNVEDFQVTTKINVSFLDDIATLHRNVLNSITSYLEVKEVVPLSCLNKNIQISLRDTALRLDSLKKLILVPLINKVSTVIEFSDGTKAPQWHVSGLITQISLGELFNIVDPSKLQQLGVILQTQIDISPIGLNAQNLQFLELQDCPALDDISPLQNLTNLKSLLLFKALKLTDISPLGSLSSLKTLNLRACESVEDISPLAACSGIKRLAITGNNAIRNFDAIQTMLELEILDLSGCTRLVSLSCLPDSDYLEVLVLVGCSDLQNLEWFHNHSGNLKMLKLNECKQATDLSGLADAVELISLNVSGLKELTSLDGIQNCTALKHLETVGCSNLVNMAPIFGKLKSLEALKLNGNTSLVAADAASLLQCQLMHLDVQGCKAVFLSELFSSKSIVFLTSAKEAIKSIFEGTVIVRYQVKEAIELVETVFTGLDFDNLEQADATMMKLTQLHDILKDVPKIAYGVVESPPFLNIWKSITSNATHVALKTKLLEFFLDTISLNRHSALKIDDNPRLFTSFLELITNASREEGSSFNNVGHMSVKIVSTFLKCLRRVIYESRKYAPEVIELTDKAVVDHKPSPLVVLKLMTQCVQDIEAEGITNVILTILEFKDSEKDHVASCFELLRNYAQVINIVNDIKAVREGLGKKKNEEFPLENLRIPSHLVEKVVPILVEKLDDIDDNTRLDSVTLLMLLIEEDGEDAVQRILAKPDLPLSLLESIFISAFKYLSSSKDDDLAKEATTRCIANGTLLLKNIPSSKFKELYSGDAKAVKLIISMLETNNDLMQVCIRDENEPSNINASENINKFLFVKHINLLLDCITYMTERPEDVDAIYKVAENLPGVIASLLHAASDELDVFDRAIGLITKLSLQSDLFCKKVQYLYTNSDIVIALKLFIDPKPQQRPRIRKNLNQKLFGLKLLLVLTDSSNFCIKFLDHKSNEMSDFEKQFRRFVFQIKAKNAWEDHNGLSAAALFVGKLMKLEGNSPTKIRSLIQNYIWPLLDVLQKISSADTREHTANTLQREEEDAIEFDIEAEKTSRKRKDAPRSPLDLFFTNLVGTERVLLQRDSTTVAEYIFAEDPEPEAPQTGGEGSVQPAPLHDFMQLFAQLQNAPTIGTGNNGDEATRVLGEFVRLTTQQSPIQTVQVLNWGFRITCFLAQVFRNGGYVSLGVLSPAVLRSLVWCLSSSDSLEVEDNATIMKGIKLLKAGAADLLSTILSEFLAPKGRKLVSIEGHDLNLIDNDDEVVPQPRNQQQQDHVDILALLTGNLFANRQDNARQELEQRKKAEAALVRTILTKQRQIRHVQNLSQELINKEEGFEESFLLEKKSVDTKKVSVLDKPGVKAMKRVDNVWNEIMITVNPLGVTKTLVVESDIPYVLSSCFALFVTSCRITAIKENGTLQTELNATPQLLPKIHENFVTLLQSGTHIVDFVRLLAHTNDAVTYEFLLGVVEKFAKGNESNFCFLASLFLLEILNSDTEESMLLKNIFGSYGDNGWILPSMLAGYLEKRSEKLSEIEEQVSQNILLILGILLEKDPVNLLNILEANAESGLLKFLVNTLVSSTDGETSVAKIALNLVKIISKISDEHLKQKEVLSDKFMNEGLLEVLSSWQNTNGDSAVFESLTPFHRELGLAAISVAISSSNAISQASRHSFGLTLVDWLAKKPNSYVAKALVQLEPELSEEGSELLLKKFSRYDFFEEAIAKELEVEKEQVGEGDIVMGRIRGFPHQMSISKFYLFEFFEATGSAAVKEFCHINDGSVYFEVVVVKDRIKYSGRKIAPAGAVGIVSPSFPKGILAGSFQEGIGDDGNEFSCAHTITTEDKHGDVIGVLINVTKGYVKFYRNGRKISKVHINFLSKGFSPAISGRNVDLQVNLGTVPFSHFNKSWKSCISVYK